MRGLLSQGLQGSGAHRQGGSALLDVLAQVACPLPVYLPIPNRVKNPTAAAHFSQSENRPADNAARYHPRPTSARRRRTASTSQTETVPSGLPQVRKRPSGLKGETSELRA